MWFHMIRPDAEVIGNSLKNTELVRDRIEDFSRTDRHLFAAEIFPVEKTRMRPNRHALITGRGNRLMHRFCVAGVKAARDACG